MPQSRWIIGSYLLQLFQRVLRRYIGNIALDAHLAVLRDWFIVLLNVELDSGQKMFAKSLFKSQFTIWTLRVKNFSIKLYSHLAFSLNLCLVNEMYKLLDSIVSHLEDKVVSEAWPVFVFWFFVLAAVVFLLKVHAFCCRLWLVVRVFYYIPIWYHDTKSDNLIILLGHL